MTSLMAALAQISLISFIMEQKHETNNAAEFCGSFPDCYSLFFFFTFFWGLLFFFFTKDHFCSDCILKNLFRIQLHAAVRFFVVF